MMRPYLGIRHMFIIDALVDMVGYMIARAILPVISLGKVSVESVSSRETGFNWLGYKVIDGKILFSSPMGGWIGLFILVSVISMLVLLAECLA